jgi:DNA/RNA-binding domain of Phe-tRNA-synthetase-like protein
MAVFQYHADILTDYPDLAGGVIIARDLQGGDTPEGLRQQYQAEQQATIQRIGETPLSQIESLAAWRGAFRKFGVDPTQYRCAAEALLRRLTKKGDIPNINLLVDISNLVSIRYGLPIAVFDTRAVNGVVTAHQADGTERFTNLGDSEVVHPEPGEVVFSDEAKMVIARRWCWRQSAESAARPDTTQAIITVEAHHADGRADVQAALDDLLGLLAEYAGGMYESGLLGREQRAI